MKSMAVTTLIFWIICGTILQACSGTGPAREPGAVATETEELDIALEVEETDIPREVEETDIPREVEETDIPREVEELVFPVVDFSTRSARELVGVIMESATGLEAAAAVQEALRRAGVSIVHGEQILFAGEEPTAVNPATLEESLFLAMEARQRGTMFRLTVAELGQMLSDLGFPFREGADPGEEMLGFLQVWVQAAQANPQQAGSFVPLFVEVMIEQDQSGLQLLSEGVTANQVRMGLLELELFAAELTRYIDSSGVVTHSATNLQMLLGALVVQMLPKQNTSQCTPWYKSLFQGKLAGWDGVLEQAAPWINPISQISQSLNKALDAFDIQVDKALGVSAIGARLFKLAALRATMKIEVSLMGEQQVHRPLPSDAYTYYGFTARVGVDPALWKSYMDLVGEKGAESLRVARECMNALGISMLTDPADLAAELPNFWVEWVIDQGEDYVNWSPDFQEAGGADDHQGYWRAPLAMASTTSGEARFKVQLNKVKKEAPGHTGDEMKAPVVVCAEVDMTQPPSVGTFVNGAKGGLGLADSIAELAGGMLMKVAKPKGCNDPALQLVWHEGEEVYLLKGKLTLHVPPRPYLDGVCCWNDQEIIFEIPIYLSDENFQFEFFTENNLTGNMISYNNVAYFTTHTNIGGKIQASWSMNSGETSCSGNGSGEGIEVAVIRDDRYYNLFILTYGPENECYISLFSPGIYESGFILIPRLIVTGEVYFDKRACTMSGCGLESWWSYELVFEPLPEDYGQSATHFQDE